MKKTITPKRLAPTRLALKCAATLVAAMALACSTQADPNLTNGLLAYWPMDDTNSGISSPDVQNGYDLTPRSGGGSTIVTFPGHLSVVPGVRSNAVSFNGGTGATVLAYISSQNQWGTPSTQLPPSQYPSWTLSFWVRGQAANNGGGTRIMCMGNSGDSSPLWDLGTGGANSIPTTQIDQFVRQIPDANAQGTTFVNANTGSGNHRAINANWLDGSWHNITFEAQYVTNYYAPTIIGATVDPKSGTISIPFSSIPLDSLATNQQYQVNTNQQYQLQTATDLSAPIGSRWTTIATVGTSGYAGTTLNFNFDPLTNNNTKSYYRVQGPAMRVQQWLCYMDGVLVGDSLKFNNGSSFGYTPDSAEPIGVPLWNGANYMQNVGSHPAGSDPDAIQPPLGAWREDTLAFGGISRNGTTSSYLTGQLDDVAVWKRALSASEIASYMANGITNPAHLVPLQITLDADFPAVATGDSVNLTWSGAKDGNSFTLNPGGINETGNTIQGSGHDTQIVNATTTFTMTETRGVASVNASRSVTAVPGVSANWRYLEGFDLLPTNGIGGQPLSASSIAKWSNPQAGYTPNLLIGRVYSSSVDANKYFAFDGQVSTGTGAGQGNGALAGRHINGESVPVGASNTLYFTFYIDPAVNNPDPNQSGQIPDVNLHVGLSDLGLRDAADFDGTAGSPGPAVFIVRNQLGGGGPIDLVCRDGSGAMALTPGTYDYLTEPNTGDPAGLAVGKVYKVWIDFINNDPGVAGGFQSGGAQTNGAYYSVWLQREDWANRTNLFQAITATNSTAGLAYPPGMLVSGRDAAFADTVIGMTDPTLRTLFVAAAPSVAPTETNMIRIDNIYLSKSGYNSTMPIATGSMVK